MLTLCDRGGVGVQKGLKQYYVINEQPLITFASVATTTAHTSVTIGSTLFTIATSPNTATYFIPVMNTTSVIATIFTLTDTDPISATAVDISAATGCCCCYQYWNCC